MTSATRQMRPCQKSAPMFAITPARSALFEHNRGESVKHCGSKAVISVFCVAARAVLVRVSLFLGGVCRVVLLFRFSSLALVVVGFARAFRRLAVSVPRSRLARCRRGAVSAVRRVSRPAAGLVRPLPSSVFPSVGGGVSVSVVASGWCLALAVLSCFSSFRRPFVLVRVRCCSRCRLSPFGRCLVFLGLLLTFSSRPQQ